jgi:hypothetical protein
MKGLGAVFMIAVLTIGAFTSIPNVDAIGEYGNLDFTQAKGTSHLTYGSASGKVCGLELCGSKSMPVVIPQNVTKTIVIEQSGANKALERALSGGEAAEIIANYNSYKGVEIVTQIDNSTESLDFNNFANPGFLNQKAQSTVMKTHVDAEELVIEIPSYMKKSYANPDHPQYIPKVKPILNVTETEIITETPKVESFLNMTDADADMILFNLGFDIDMSKVGVCGPGTELVHGVCLIDGEVPESVNTDWADFWDTKEDKEVVLEQVIMTNGTEAIPVVSDDVVEPPMEEPVEEPIVEETVSIPSFEESTIGMNTTNINIEELPVPEILEEVSTSNVSTEELEALALESENNSRYSEAAQYYADAASIHNDNGNYEKAAMLYTTAAGHLENSGNITGADEYRQLALSLTNP